MNIHVAKVTKLINSFIFVITLSFIPGILHAEKLIVIKYRDTPVDVDKPYFEPLDTLKSSFVKGAWYDKSQKYMIISLASSNYQHCGVGADVWEAFKIAPSFGRFYLAMIKGKFDCRLSPVPR